MKIYKKDLETIKEVIKSAETKTSGEIVPVIVKQSDDYLYSHYLCALLYTFIGVILTFCEALPKTQVSPIIYITIMAIVGYSLPKISSLKRALLNKKERDEEVNQKALQTFFTNNLHRTKDGTGILIFISLLERKVQILGDHGINKKVDQNFWNDEVDKLVQSIKEDNLIEGLSQVISTLGDKLAEHFPIQSDDTNELKNELITDLKVH
jgi:putative membrane protein